MKFLVDVQLPAVLCRWLEERGHTARHLIRLEGGLRLPDRKIWEMSKTAGEVIVSKDWDFFELAQRHQPPPQVLLIRVGNCANRQLFTFLGRAWASSEPALEQGAKLVMVTQRHVEVQA